jgi:hypothetical protein
LASAQLEALETSRLKHARAMDQLLEAAPPAVPGAAGEAKSGSQGHPGYEGKGDFKAAAPGGAGSGGSASAGARRVHPFFAGSPGQVPGQWRRFHTFGNVLCGIPDRLVASPGGALAWLDAAGLRVGMLMRDGRKDKFQAEGKTALLDLAPAPGGVLVLAQTGSECRVNHLPEDGGKLQAVNLTAFPEGLEQRPRSFLDDFDPDWRPGIPHLALFQPGALLRHPVLMGAHIHHWDVYHQTKGPSLAPEARLLTVGKGDAWYLDPVRGSFGRLADYCRYQRRFAVQELGRGGFAHLAWTPLPGLEAGAYRIAATAPGADRIAWLDLPDGKAGEVRLRAGSAPAALVGGPGGNLLVALADGFARLSPDGAVTRVPVLGPRPAPRHLVLDAAAGKLFFTEAGQPYVNALTLGEPGRLTEGDGLLGSHLGPSLVQEAGAETKAGTGARAQAKPAPGIEQAETPLETRDGGSALESPGADSARAQGGEALQAAATGSLAQEASAAAPVESKSAAMDLDTLASAPEAGDPTIGDLLEADNDDLEGLVAWGGRALPAEERKSAAAAPAPSANRSAARISRERLRHILEEHSHRDGLDLDQAGLVKGQFAPDLSRAPRDLRRLLLAGARSAGARLDYDGAEDTVIHFTAEQPVGRVRAARARTWSETRRVRVVLAWDRVQQRHWLVTAYPVP